jgi:hypothetical protein
VAGVQDDDRQQLFDPRAARALVLAHRPPAASAVAAVVSDTVWTGVLRLLRWAAADPQGVATRQTGTWWRLATGCADLLRRLPALGDEAGEPYPHHGREDDAVGHRPAERIAHAAERLAGLWRSPAPVPLALLAVRVDALGAAAVGALAERAVGALP